MSKQNIIIFNNYSEDSHFKTNDKAKKKFPSIVKFPNSLGFDEMSNGFIVLHKKHMASGIEQEILACIIHKKQGFCVDMIEEFDFKPSVDIRMNNDFFEIKRIAKATDVVNAIMVQCKRCEKKSPNLVLHIDQKIEPSNLKRALRKALERYNKLEKVVLIFRNIAFDLSKEAILKGNYHL